MKKILLVILLMIPTVYASNNFCVLLNNGNICMNETGITNGSDSINFGGAGTGTVTQVDTGDGLQGGPIVNTGNISVDAPTTNSTQALGWDGASFTLVNVGSGSGTDNYTTAASVVLSGTTRTLNLKQAIGNNITSSWIETSSGTNLTGSGAAGNLTYWTNSTNLGALNPQTANSNQYSYWNGTTFLVRADLGTTYTGVAPVIVSGTLISLNTSYFANGSSNLTLDDIAANIGNYSGNATGIYNNITSLQTFRNNIYVNVTDLQTSNGTIWGDLNGKYVNITSLQAFRDAIYVNTTALQLFRDNIYTNVTSLQLFRNNIYTNVSDLQTSNASIWSDINGKYTNITALQTFRDNVYVNVTNLQSSNSSTNTRIDTLNISIDNLYTNITSIQTFRDNIYSNVTDLQNSNTSTNARIDSINATGKTIQNTDGLISVTNSTGTINLNASATDIRYKPNYTYFTFVSSELLTLQAGFLSGSTVNGGAGGATAASISRPGIIELNDSTTANGGVTFMTGPKVFIINGTENSTLIFNPVGGKSGTSILRFGFQDVSNIGAGATLPGNGCWIEVNNTAPPVTGSNIYGVCANNSQRTNTTTNYTFTNNTWYTANIYIDANALNVNFSITSATGALLWSNNITTNIPVTTGHEAGWGVVAYENTTNAGTQIFLLDYLALGMSRVLNR